MKYTPSGHSPIKVARVYLRVSTDEQDLTRQSEIEQSARSAGYYIAGVYREKASGARADRPELLRMIADLQPGEVVVAEKIDRISRLPLAEAEQPARIDPDQGGEARGARPGRSLRLRRRKRRRCEDCARLGAGSTSKTRLADGPRRLRNQARTATSRSPAC